MLRFPNSAVPRPQIRLERAVEQLQQDLEANLCDMRIVPSLAELITDKGMLRVGKLMETEGCVGGTQLGPNEISSSVWDVRVLDAEDHGDLGGAQAREEVERVGAVRGGRVGGGVRA